MLSLTKTHPQKRAFVTGAASGLGRELSLILAADGWHIAIVDINEQSLSQTAEEINQLGGTSISFLLNVADPIQYKSIAKDCLSTLGGIDLLINNAGIGDFGPLDEYGIDNWNWLVGVNQMSVVYGIHYFLPVMKAQNSGHIINIASAAAFSSMPNMGAYNATKAAVLSISETLYAEVRDMGIQVSVALPTFFKTNIMQHCRGQGEEKAIAEKIVNESKITPKEIAYQILKAAGNKKLYIVLPNASKLFFLIKRLFPMLMMKLNSRKPKSPDGFIKFSNFIR